MKILVISNEFPNSKQLTKGIFIKQQIIELSKHSLIKVVAPVPWSLPIRGFKKSYIFYCVAKKELIDGIETFHPKYLITPKIGRSFYGLFYFLGIVETVRSISENFNFDVILAYFAYPDGFAALLLAKLFRKPLVIKVMGSDINVYTKGRIRRFLTCLTLKKAERVIAVTEDLKKKMIALGISESKITVIYNGVDSSKFKPMIKNECRRDLGLPLDKRILLFIGGLTRIKGVNYLIDAYRRLNDNSAYVNTLLVLVGDGELKNIIEYTIKKYNLNSRVKLVGSRPHHEIPLWINACDIVCIPSVTEGCSNVALEALACNTPIVATRVGGISEIILSEECGILSNSYNIDPLSHSLQKALDKKWIPESMGKRASEFSWQITAIRILEQLKAALQLKQSLVS